MTTERFRQLVRKFHPDTNGGRSPRIDLLRMVLAARSRQNAKIFNRCCLCGVTISRTAKRCLLHRFKKASAFLASLLLSVAARSEGVTLAWDAAPTPVAAYVISSGTSPESYAGAQLEVSGLTARVEGLTAGKTYYFVVRGRTAGGELTLPSNEVGYSVPPVVVVEILPPPWRTVDIGPVTTIGAAYETNGTFTLIGSGDLFGRSDTFRFVYQPISGDGDITARLSDYEAGKLGVMVRESTSPLSKYVFAGLGGQYGDYRTQKRTSTSGKTASNNYGGASIPDVWVRLVRQGNSVVAYKSVDGASWTRMNSTSITMTSEVQAGLAFASGALSLMSTGRLSNVRVTP